jgi:hypothetical protein
LYTPKRGDVDELGAANYPHLTQNVPDGVVTEYQRQLILDGVWPGSLPDGVFGHRTAHPTERVDICNHLQFFFYSQGDPQWADRILGRNRTFRQAGCLVTCLAMWLSYHHKDTTISPKDLDEYLDKHQGYANDSVIWDVALSIFPEPLKREKITEVSGIQDEISKVLPIIARVDYGRDLDLEYNHFVVIAGVLPIGYAIMDPATWRGNFFRWMTTENVLQTTSRKGGYTLVGLDHLTFKTSD